MTAVERQAAGTSDRLLGQLADLGGLEVADGGATRGAVTVRVLPETLEEATHVIAGTAGTRLADMFADNGGDAPTLRLVWAHDSGYLLTETEIEGDQYPPLSDIAPAAFVEECEIYEQFGIRPGTGKPLNRLMLPPHAGPDFPRLGHRPTEPLEEAHAPHTVGGQAFEFPFGPVRQVGVESLYYGLVTSGEEVVDLYLFAWHKHRGVEWRLRGRTPDEAIFAAERAEGLSAVAVGWAFSAAAEAALGVRRRPGREDQGGHARARASVQPCGGHGGVLPGHRAHRGPVRRLRSPWTAAAGQRGRVRPPLPVGVVTPHGAGRAPDASLLRRELPGAYGQLRRAADALLRTNSFVDRLEATGILSAEQARRLGLVGPVARATGLRVDARVNAGGPYAEHPVTVVTADAGDVLARFQVMLGEAAEVVGSIGEFLDAGTTADRMALPPGGGMGLGWAESPRGEALAWVALDEAGRIIRARLRPGSVRNWRGFDDACRSQNVFTDIPIIEASFWLTAAGLAR